MQRLLLIASACLISAGAALPAVAADYETTVSGTNPLANFRLTAPGTPSTVGGYTTTYTGTTGTGTGAPIVADPANTAATFAGDNANPSEVFTSLSGLIPGTGSINLWINLATLPSTTGTTFYLAGESESGNDFDMQIQQDNRLYIYTGSGENTSVALDTTSLVGQWHMLTATFDGTLGGNSTRALYVDGVEVASYVGGVNPTAKTNPFTIGYSNVFGGRDTVGSIDEVSVWNYSLSSDQVGAIYASASQPAAAIVPEPASWAMMILGFGLVGGMARRRDTPAALRI